MSSFPKRQHTVLMLSLLLILAASALILTPIMAHDGMTRIQQEATPEVTEPPTDTPTPSPTPLPGGIIIVIEGPVAAININIITIYNINVTVAADNPILTVIKIGDIVHVEGEEDDSGVIVATVVTLTIANVTVNGQVTAINGNIVMVGTTAVQFDPDDPALTLIQIGEMLNLEGNYQGSGTTLVFIVINVTIINVNITTNPAVPANCKVSKNGHIKCSKKH